MPTPPAPQAHRTHARLADRLALDPRPDKAPPRTGFGLAEVDGRIGGGLERGGLHEIRAPHARDIAAATGLVLSLAARLMRDGGRGRVLWITDPAALSDCGLLFPDGIAQYGLDPAALVQVHPLDLKTALWAAEEGARCTDLAAVVLQVKGNPARLDRTAGRRLLLRARASGTAILVLRQEGAEEAGAALTRWRVFPLPSRPDRIYPAGVGLPRHDVTLERSRPGLTGRWTLSWNPKTRSFAHAPDPADTSDAGAGRPLPVARPAASSHGPHRPGALGQVVALRRTP